MGVRELGVQELERHRAGLLSEAEWRQHVRPHLLRLLERLGEAGVPRILFLHSAPQLVPAFLELPCEVLATDWRTDLAAIRKSHPQLVLQGNLDPAILLAPPEIVGIAYDSGGVTTSTVTVPLVTALGVGLASSLKGRNPMTDGFGLIAFASLTPILFVLLYGIITQWI